QAGLGRSPAPCARCGRCAPPPRRSNSVSSGESLRACGALMQYDCEIAIQFRGNRSQLAINPVDGRTKNSRVVLFIVHGPLNVRVAFQTVGSEKTRRDRVNARATLSNST